MAALAHGIVNVGLRPAIGSRLLNKRSESTGKSCPYDCALKACRGMIAGNGEAVDTHHSGSVRIYGRDRVAQSILVSNPSIFAKTSCEEDGCAGQARA